MKRTSSHHMLQSAVLECARLARCPFAVLLSMLAFQGPALSANRFFIESQTLPAGATGQVVVIQADIDVPDEVQIAQGLSAFQVAVKFDPAVVRVTDIDVAEDAATAFFKLPPENAIHNETGEIFFGVLVSNPTHFDPTDVIPEGPGRRLVKLTLDVLSTCSTESALDLTDALTNDLWRNAMTIPPGTSIRAPDLLLEDGKMTIENDLSQFQGRFELLKGTAVQGKKGSWSFALKRAIFDPGFEIPAERISHLAVSLEVNGERYFDDPSLTTMTHRLNRRTGNLTKILIKQGKDKLTIDLAKNLVKFSLKNIPAEEFDPDPAAGPVQVNIEISSAETLFRTVSRVEGSFQSTASKAGRKFVLGPQAGALVLEAKPCE